MVAPLNVFVSYSHMDKQHMESFTKITSQHEEAKRNSSLDRQRNLQVGVNGEKKFMTTSKTQKLSYF